MDPAILTTVRRFFAEPRQPKLRRDLARELRDALGVAGDAAEAAIDELMAQNFLCAMKVHFYDAAVENVVQAHGVRPAVRLDREVGSGRWRRPVGV